MVCGTANFIFFSVSCPLPIKGLWEISTIKKWHRTFPSLLQYFFKGLKTFFPVSSPATLLHLSFHFYLAIQSCLLNQSTDDDIYSNKFFVTTSFDNVTKISLLTGPLLTLITRENISSDYSKFPFLYSRKSLACTIMQVITCFPYKTWQNFMHLLLLFGGRGQKFLKFLG